MSSTCKTEKKGKGKKKEKKADSEEAPAASLVALKRKAITPGEIRIEQASGIIAGCIYRNPVVTNK